MRLATKKDIDLAYWLLEYTSGNILWENIEGERIPLNEINPQYLYNIKAFLERKNEWSPFNEIGPGDADNM